MLKKIYERIISKGWNPYPYKEGLIGDISQGPATTLEIGRSYNLQPRVSDPASREQIDKASRYIARTRRLPLIQHRGTLVGVNIFQVNKDSISVPIGSYSLSYGEFYKALDTLPTVADIN